MIEDSTELTLSDTISRSTSGLQHFIKNKILDTVNKYNSYKIMYKTENEIMKQYLEQILNDLDFIEKSKDIAIHLHNVQNQVNYAGVLLFIECEVDGISRYVILKLELQRGVKIEKDVNTNSYNIIEIEDLILSHKTKLFKFAMLYSIEENLEHNGIFYDFQTNLSNKKNTSNWFIDKFLCCIPYDDPKITTKNFYYKTVEFINSKYNIMEQIKLNLDLKSYLLSNINEVSIQDFSDRYITDADDQDDYLNLINENEIPLTFVKDNIEVNNVIKKMVVKYENDIEVKFPSENQNITIEELEDTNIISIKSSITNLY